MNSQKRFSALLTALLALTVVFGGMAFAQTSTKKAKDKSATTTPSGAKVDLNSASESDLNNLPGVGPATTKKIIAGRPYSSVDDLKKAGLTAKQIDKIRDLTTVSGAAATSATAKPSASTPAPTQPPPATASKGQMRSEEKQSTASAGMPQKDVGTTTPPPAGSGQVWVNLDTKVYHKEGDRWYGKTKNGKYMSEADAQAAGYRAAKK